MDDPPFLLDGSRVVEFAVFDRAHPPDGRASVIAEGISLDRGILAGLVIAEDLVEGGVFLIHCTDDWQALAAGRYEGAEAARASAARSHSGVEIHWKRYRELSPAERAEIESTRAFLREIANEHPDE